MSIYTAEFVTDFLVIVFGPEKPLTEAQARTKSIHLTTLSTLVPFRPSSLMVCGLDKSFRAGLSDGSLSKRVGQEYVAGSAAMV